MSKDKEHNKDAEYYLNQLAKFFKEQEGVDHNDKELDIVAYDDVEYDDEVDPKLDQFLAKLTEELDLIMPDDDLTEETAITAEDFIKLATFSLDQKEALTYAKRAKKLDPDNLDAERIIIEMSSQDAFSLLNKLKQAITHGDKLMERLGFLNDDCIGNYWNIEETRPYLRLRVSYMNTLLDGRMMRRAAEEGERLIELCANDNLGVRYTLMHLYAYLEDERAALALLNRFNHLDEDETQMILPLSALYFKLEQFDTAEFYLRRLEICNPDTTRFFHIMANMDDDLFDEELSNVNPFAYRHGTIDEFFNEFQEQGYLFEELGFYFRWADKKLRKGGRVSKRRQRNKKKTGHEKDETT